MRFIFLCLFWSHIVIFILILDFEAQKSLQNLPPPPSKIHSSTPINLFWRSTRVTDLMFLSLEILLQR